MIALMNGTGTSQAWHSMGRILPITAANTGLPYPYGILSTYSRLTIGLCKYTTADEETIAKILGLTEIQLQTFVMMLRRHQEGKAVFDSMLPAMFGESLPEGSPVVHCRKCKRPIDWVPCVLCCDSREVFIERRDRKEWEDDPEPTVDPAESTQELPGTVAKIEVLRRRVETGVRLWHPDDKRLVM